MAYNIDEFYVVVLVRFVVFVRFNSLSTYISQCDTCIGFIGNDKPAAGGVRWVGVCHTHMWLSIGDNKSVSKLNEWKIRGKKCSFRWKFNEWQRNVHRHRKQNGRTETKFHLFQLVGGQRLNCDDLYVGNCCRFIDYQPIALKQITRKLSLFVLCHRRMSRDQVHTHWIGRCV